MRPLPFLAALLLLLAPAAPRALAQSTSAKKEPPKLAAAAETTLADLLARGETGETAAAPWRALLRGVLASEGDAQTLEDALERVVKDGTVRRRR